MYLAVKCSIIQINKIFAEKKEEKKLTNHKLSKITRNRISETRLNLTHAVPLDLSGRRRK